MGELKNIGYIDLINNQKLREDICLKIWESITENTKHLNKNKTEELKQEEHKKVYYNEEEINQQGLKSLEDIENQFKEIFKTQDRKQNLKQFKGVITETLQERFNKQILRFFNLNFIGLTKQYLINLVIDNNKEKILREMELLKEDKKNHYLYNTIDRKINNLLVNCSLLNRENKGFIFNLKRIDNLNKFNLDGVKLVNTNLYNKAI